MCRRISIGSLKRLIVVGVDDGPRSALCAPRAIRIRLAYRVADRVNMVRNAFSNFKVASIFK